MKMGAPCIGTVSYTHLHTYQLFTQGTNGARIVYLEGYKELHRFLTQVLQWPDAVSYTHLDVYKRQLPDWHGYFYWNYGTKELNFRDGDYHLDYNH